MLLLLKAKMLELSRALFKSEVMVITTLGLRDDAFKTSNKFL